MIAMSQNRNERDQMYLKTETGAIWTRYAFLMLRAGSYQEMTENGARSAEVLQPCFVINATEEIMVAQ
jgi:hypothetical protein